MGNRKQPFGYKMELGEMVPHPREADMVRSIYLKYLGGASFKALTEELREQNVPYSTGKPWNKNMVARILEDSRYTGTDRFPALIPQEQFSAAQERREQMRPEHKQTPAQKELRKLCGSVPPMYVEQKMLHLLNRLIQNPLQIQHKSQEIEQAMHCLKQQRRELDGLLHTPPVDEEALRSMALSYADAMLDAIGPEEYETERLRRLFSTRIPMTELDAELPRQSVRQITYDSQTITILLKNNQEIKE